MAIEQLQFAPVITPRTLEELARNSARGQTSGVGKVVADLIPVALEVVENYFKPISQVRNEEDFRIAFATQSHNSNRTASI